MCILPDFGSGLKCTGACPRFGVAKTRMCPITAGLSYIEHKTVYGRIHTTESCGTSFGALPLTRDSGGRACADFVLKQSRTPGIGSRYLIMKVCVVGAAGGIGQPLSLLLKLSQHVDELSLYDVVPVVPGTHPSLVRLNWQIL
jgi:hypothetical protein